MNNKQALALLVGALAASDGVTLPLNPRPERVMLFGHKTPVGFVRVIDRFAARNRALRRRMGVSANNRAEAA